MGDDWKTLKVQENQSNLGGGAADCRWTCRSTVVEDTMVIMDIHQQVEWLLKIQENPVIIPGNNHRYD